MNPVTYMGDTQAVCTTATCQCNSMKSSQGNIYLLSITQYLPQIAPYPHMELPLTTQRKTFTTKAKQESIATIVLSIVATEVLAFLCIRFFLVPRHYDVPLQGTFALLVSQVPLFSQHRSVADAPSQINVVTKVVSIDATSRTVVADWFPRSLDCSLPDSQAIMNLYFYP